MSKKRVEHAIQITGAEVEWYSENQRDNFYTQSPMGLAYLPAFGLIFVVNVGKYTVRPMDPMG